MNYHVNEDFTWVEFPFEFFYLIFFYTFLPYYIFKIVLSIFVKWRIFRCVLWVFSHHSNYMTRVFILFCFHFDLFFTTLYTNVCVWAWALIIVTFKWFIRHLKAIHSSPRAFLFLKLILQLTHLNWIDCVVWKFLIVNVHNCIYGHF